MSPGEREGMIDWVNDTPGVGHIKDVQANRTYGFRYSDIIAYRGEAACDLGLAAGTKLYFKPGPHNSVVYVKLLDFRAK